MADDHDSCCICLENLLEFPIVLLECGHSLHGQCLSELIRARNNEQRHLCPMCRGPTISAAIIDASLNPPPGFGPPQINPFDLPPQEFDWPEDDNEPDDEAEGPSMFEIFWPTGPPHSGYEETPTPEGWVRYFTSATGQHLMGNRPWVQFDPVNPPARLVPSKSQSWDQREIVPPGYTYTHGEGGVPFFTRDAQHIWNLPPPSDICFASVIIHINFNLVLVSKLFWWNPWNSQNTTGCRF